MPSRHKCSTSQSRRSGWQDQTPAFRPLLPLPEWPPCDVLANVTDLSFPWAVPSKEESLPFVFGTLTRDRRMGR